MKSTESRTAAPVFWGAAGAISGMEQAAAARVAAASVARDRAERGRVRMDMLGAFEKKKILALDRAASLSASDDGQMGEWVRRPASGPAAQGLPRTGD